ncbi:hypothetical protein AGLY_003101 [Aphis glycines]|uniref:RNase H type-1 domain-containing protein n=1 Tax=Aphis glycines TaxID=307491 RepID=A0A6G0U332_APHGL|nr:hypothetical protein AGLY_003101 [Aphis glycines]
MWIPAHKNIPGNEKADVAAKEAASTNINIPKLDLSSFKDTARNSLINSKKIHQRLWDQELNNKLHQIKPFLSPNPNPPSSTRRQQVIWTRMKIGHTNISHVHLMRRESRPNCEFCNNAPISTAHLLLECSNLSEQRKIFPHLKLRDILIFKFEVMSKLYYIRVLTFTTFNELNGYRKKTILSSLGGINAFKQKCVLLSLSQFHTTYVFVSFDNSVKKFKHKVGTCVRIVGAVEEKTVVGLELILTQQLRHCCFRIQLIQWEWEGGLEKLVEREVINFNNTDTVKLGSIFLKLNKYLCKQPEHEHDLINNNTGSITTIMTCAKVRSSKNALWYSIVVILFQTMIKPFEKINLNGVLSATVLILL